MKISTTAEHIMSERQKHSEKLKKKQKQIEFVAPLAS